MFSWCEWGVRLVREYDMLLMSGRKANDYKKVSLIQYCKHIIGIHIALRQIHLLTYLYVL